MVEWGRSDHYYRRKVRRTPERRINWTKGTLLTTYGENSDTIAPTLVFAFYEMAHHPEHQAQLHSALEGVDIYDRSQLRTCALLTAIKATSSKMALNHKRWLRFTTEYGARTLLIRLRAC